jgi:hypothetical protein
LKYLSALPLLLILCTTMSANAQSTDATISGVVVDSSGKVIPNADIEILNEGTGVHYSDKTNGAGIYTVSILPPGQYRVQVSKIAFKTIIKPGIILNVQGALALNFTLPVGAASETVTVSAGASVINTTDASVSTVIDRQFVENIPLNGRSFQDLISMTPGVVTQSPQVSGSIGQNGDFSVNGQRTESNYYTVDGVSANLATGNGNGGFNAASGGTVPAGTAFGTTQSLTSVDALQEFRVQSSTYSAEYGHSPGGQFSFATRSGSNDIHESAFEYLRNNFFDANDWFNDHYGDPIAALRQNDFGGTLGGPIRIPAVYDGRGRSFFFASYEGLRLTQPQAASIQYVPDNYMRQQAPAPLQPILNAFPVQNGADYGTAAAPSLAQFIESYSLPGQIDSASLRLDHTLSSRLAVFFRFGDTSSSESSRILSSKSTQNINTATYTLGATSRFLSRLDNEFRIGYARNDAYGQGTIDSFGSAVAVGLPDAMGLNGYSAAEPVFEIYIPGIGVSYLSALGISGTQNEGRQWNVINTVATDFGRHNLKFGFDYRRVESPTIPANPIAESLYFDPGAVLANSASLLFLFKEAIADPIFNETAAFAQDEWHVSSRVNLSLGLRWEVNPPPRGANGQDAYTLLGSISAPSSLSLAPSGTPLWKTAWYNFAPRAGVAWIARAVPGRETVVRAGGGVFFDSNNQIASYGFGGLGFAANSSLANSPLPVTAAELNFPIAPTAPYTSANVYAFPEHLQPPYTLQWNVSLEQAIGKEQAFTLTYVGSNGRRLEQQQGLSINALNPNFSQISYFAGNVTSSYNALQSKFQRSMAHGVQTLVSYTWSHSLDFGSNYLALPLTRGNSDFDVRHNFSAALSWDLPAWKSRKAVQALMNGWGIDARAMARTAFPVTLEGTYLTDLTTGSSYYGNVNLVPNQPIYLYGGQYPGGRAINSAAFSIPVSPDPGDAPRNFVRGFGATQENLAARRDFRLRESLRLQFRAEAFNILNHPNFGSIDSGLYDATFGQALSMLNQSLGTMASQYQQGGPRSMQFALRLVY